MHASVFRAARTDIPLEAQTVSQMVDLKWAQPEGSKLMLLAPVIRERHEHLSVPEELRAQGFVRARRRQAVRTG